MSSPIDDHTPPIMKAAPPTEDHETRRPSTSIGVVRYVPNSPNSQITMLAIHPISDMNSHSITSPMFVQSIVEASGGTQSRSESER